MRTIEITRMEDVRVGDAVVMGLGGVTVSGTLESPGTSLRPVEDWCMYFVGVGTLYARDGWTFVSATREVPEWEPGTTGTATVRGVKGVEVVRSLSANGEAWWFTPTYLIAPRGRTGHWHPDDQVTDFLPDDIEALRRSLEAAREGYRKEAADWRARDTRMGAEVERLEAEVERLRAARPVPTRKQLVDAMWPDAPEGARVGLMDLDMIDRVVALFEQGDEF